MGTSLKEALKKIGIQTAKTENERVRIDKTERRKVHDHQEQRNFCEVCQRTMPDVERYRHRNPEIPNTEWICCACADKYWLDDNTRQTNQSDYAKRNIFRREFGPTKRFEKKDFIKANNKFDKRPAGNDYKKDGAHKNFAHDRNSYNKGGKK